MLIRPSVLARRALRPVLAFSAIAIVSACGGGNGASSSVTIADESITAADSAGTREQALAASTLTWKVVASENQSFTVAETQTVRYGIDQSWVTKTVSGTVPCTNAFFGRDPVWGIVKQCQVSVSNSSTAPTSTGTPAPVVYDAGKIPARGTGQSVENIQWTGQTGFRTDIGAFRVLCDYSHMVPDDPIVLPNQPGKSHLHVFFGNTGTNANSTADSIANSGASTCRGGTANRTGYWVPAMIDTNTGTPIKPAYALMYYKTGYNGIQPWQVQSMPAGLRMIAGDSKSSKPQPEGHKFACIGKGAEALMAPAIQNCPGGSALWQLIYFPQCWDGVNLDSPDHKSHMSYPVDGACPKTHPVPLPEVSYNVIYDVPADNATRSWRLSSDTYDRSIPGGYSTHGDWMNGWNQDVMKTFIQECDRAAMDCHANLLGDGRSLM